MKSLVRWTIGVTVVAAAVALVGRVLRTPDRSARTGGGVFPSIGGDTWPPVPANPDRG